MKKIIPDEDISKIIKVYESGTATQKDIAAAWGVSQSHISRILAELRRQKAKSVVH